MAARKRLGPHEVGKGRTKVAKAAPRRQGPHEGSEGFTKAVRAARRRRRQHNGAIRIFNPFAHKGEGRTGFRRRLETLDGGGATLWRRDRAMVAWP